VIDWTVVGESQGSVTFWGRLKKTLGPGLRRATMFTVAVTGATPNGTHSCISLAGRFHHHLSVDIQQRAKAQATPPQPSPTAVREGVDRDKHQSFRLRETWRCLLF
jgi:hypothetical protein